MVAPDQNLRRRGAYALLLFVLPFCGLGIRAYPQNFPVLFSTYAPDILWALLVFAFIGFAATKVSTSRRAMISCCLCLLIECSQIYQATWINELRSTPLGGLLLGRGFLWSDLACYTLGIALGITCDFWLARSRLLSSNLTW